MEHQQNKATDLSGEREKLRERILELETAIEGNFMLISELSDREINTKYLYENSKIPVIINDLSKLKIFIEKLSAENRGNLEDYFSKNSDELIECLHEIEIVNTNPAALKLFGVNSTEEFRRKIFSLTESLSSAQLGSLLKVNSFKQLSAEGEISLKVLDDRQHDLIVRWSVIPGYESDWSRVSSALFDVSEKKAIDNEIEFRIELEKFIASTAVNFLKVPIENVDDSVNESFQELNRLLNASLSYVVIYDKKKNNWDLIFPDFRLNKDEKSKFVKNTKFEKMTWLLSRIGELEEIIISSKNEIPSSAKPELNWFKLNNIESAIFFALKPKGKLTGFIGIHTVKNINILKKPDIRRIREFAEIVLGSIERKNKDLEHKMSEERLRKIVENMPIMVNAFDKHGNIVVWNRECERVTGFHAKEIINKSNAFELLYPDPVYREKMRREWLKIGADYRNWEWKVATKKGDYKYISWSNVSNKFPIPGWAIWECGVDVTTRKRVEKDFQREKENAEAANRTKSEFLANMSHELRTPLNAILGYAQILKVDENINNLQREGLEVIERSGHHLLYLIEDILDLSKIEADRMEIKKNSFPLPEFLEGISDMISIKTRQKGLSFFYEPSLDLPSFVYGDSKRISQILLNLLSNSVKFTEKGNVFLSVSYYGSKLRFEVKDTGMGIPKSQQGKIFIPFKQIDESSKTIEGTGLGLSISQRLAELMDSEIKVKSIFGKGSSFWFEIDLPAVEDYRLTKKYEINKILGYRGKTRKILLIDDNQEHNNILVNLLAPLGFDLTIATAGYEGVAKAIEFQPHLILLDLILPDLDGLSVAFKLRKSILKKQMKIITVSANISDEILKKSLNAGCNDFITKPFIADELYEKIRTHLKIKWIFEKDSVHDEHKEKKSEIKEITEILAPPTEETRDLYKSVMHGDISALHEQLDIIEKTDNKYKPFVDELRILANRFHIKQIREFVNKYIGS